MVSDVIMTSSEGNYIINMISKTLCCKSNSSQETAFTQEQQQIYLGDHLTRSWTRDERAQKTAVSSPVTSDPGNNIQSAQSVIQIRQNHAPISRTRSSLREPRGSRRNWASRTAMQNVTQEEFNEWKQSFDKLLKSQVGSRLFRMFLESQVAEENLLFWQAVEGLKNTTRERKLQKAIREIYEEYISVYSNKEINIGYKLREDIVEQLGSPNGINPNVFEEAQTQIYRLMLRDSFPRFLTSTQERLDEIRTKASKATGKSPEAKRKTKSRVLCCYGNDPDETARSSPPPEEQKLKVEESSSSPVNGHAERISDLTDGAQAARNSENTITPPGAVDVHETKGNSTGDDVKDDVTHPNRVSDLVTNSKVAVEVEVLENPDTLDSRATISSPHEPDENE